MTPVNRRLVGIALFGLLLVANEYAPEPIEIPGMGWVESLFGVGSGPVRVLIVEDSTKRVGLSREQLKVLTASDDKSVEAWLNAHCAKGSDGNPAWRKVSVPADFKGDADAAVWQAEYDLRKEPLPWFCIATASGSVRYSGPVVSESDTLSHLRRWGGD